MVDPRCSGVIERECTSGAAGGETEHVDSEALRSEMDVSCGKPDEDSPSSSGTKESSGALHCMASRPRDGVLVKESSRSNMTLPDDVDFVINDDELEEPWFCRLALTMARLMLQWWKMN